MLDALRTQGRYEKKFQLFGDPKAMRSRLLNTASALGYEPDAHGAWGGQYVLSSLYFDTPDFRSLWANADGDYFHLKFRIRAYEGGKELFFEIKYKLGDLIFKRRRALPMRALYLEECRREFRSLVLTSRSDALIQRGVLQAVEQLRPACVVRYHRTALVAGFQQRVCLDTEISFGHPVLEPALWFTGCAPPANAQLGILEVKAPPEVVTRSILAFGAMARRPITRFSKYCEAATWLYNDPTEYGAHPYLSKEKPAWQRMLSARGTSLRKPGKAEALSTPQFQIAPPASAEPEIETPAFKRAA